MTQLGLPELGRLHSRLVSAAAYARHDLALVDIERTELRRMNAVLEAKIAGTKDERTQQWKIKNAFRLDARWRELSRALVNADSYHILLSALVTSLEEKAKQVSRELSRRGMEMELDT